MEDNLDVLADIWKINFDWETFERDTHSQKLVTLDVPTVERELAVHQVSKKIFYQAVAMHA